MQPSPSLWHKFLRDQAVDLKKLKEFHAVLHKMNNLHSFTWDAWFSSGIHHQSLLCKANVYRDSGRVSTLHREKVIQELWSLVTQTQSNPWAGVNLWFMERVTLIYTCLVSDVVSINIYNILFSETECWARGTAAWSSWAVLTQFYLQMQSLELRERSNFMSRGSMTALGAIVKCFPLKSWKLRALLFAF